MIFFAIASVVTLSLILPFNIRGSTNTTDLSRFSAANIDRGSNFLWAHFSFYIISLLIIMYFLYRESTLFIKLRLKYLLDPEYKSTTKAHTIMVCGLKSELTDEKTLKNVFSALPGKNFYAQKHSNKVLNLKRYILRERSINDTENDIPALDLETSNSETSNSNNSKKNTNSVQLSPPSLPTMSKRKISFRYFKRDENNSQKFLTTEKFNKIEYYSKKLLKYNKKIKEFRENKLSSLKKKSSGFVTFSDQISAHLAVQSLVYHKPLAATPKFMDTDPANVVWNNLNLSPYDRKIRKTISVVITVFIVIAWSSITILIVGLINSNSFLGFLGLSESTAKFINKIKGFLGPLLIAILVSLLPMFLRFLLVLEGTMRKSDIEIGVMHRFFLFLAFTVFILPTFASSLGALWDNFAQLMVENKEQEEVEEEKRDLLSHDGSRGASINDFSDDFRHVENVVICEKRLAEDKEIMKKGNLIRKISKRIKNYSKIASFRSRGGLNEMDSDNGEESMYLSGEESSHFGEKKSQKKMDSLAKRLDYLTTDFAESSNEEYPTESGNEDGAEAGIGTGNRQTFNPPEINVVNNSLENIPLEDEYITKKDTEIEENEAFAEGVDIHKNNLPGRRASSLGVSPMFENRSLCKSKEAGIKLNTNISRLGDNSMGPETAVEMEGTFGYLGVQEGDIVNNKSSRDGLLEDVHPSSINSGWAFYGMGASGSNGIVEWSN
ncbi:hypothetical protein AYI68_g4536 [Smittium mucronatum]|uniref:CSC1/OSCA1-like cytosolic domain-containing protein n=1 Tax=Smittium mucronatum TaxID=133383 RepID=A0A1R0GWT5_9FUNG|nr:hypothetical protein AYI68_g4536 [Smittium mucronatum]